MTDGRDAGRGPAAPPVYLHIGVMKTGTSYLQQVLVDHEQQMSAAGYLFPGDTWVAQVRAAQEVTDSVPHDPALRSESHGAWQALVDEVHRHDGAASVVSMEFLSHADDAAARRAVASLEPAEVHVILTVRDATAIVPAQWQTAIRNGKVTTWPDFRSRIRKATGLRARRGWFPDPSAELFRRVQDVDRILETWGRCVPPERIHVVTVPPSGSDPTLLWRRFSGVVGLDPGMGAETARVNQSLGYPSAELLRRINARLGPLPPSDYNATLRGQLAGRVLTRRSKEEARPLLDQGSYEFALEWNRRTRDAVRRGGVALVGDVDDLPVTPAPHHSDIVDDTQPPPSDEELLAAAEAAAVGMRALIKRRSKRAVKKGIDVAGLTPQTPSAGAAGRSGDPVEAAVAEVTALCRTAIDLRRRIRSHG